MAELKKLYEAILNGDNKTALAMTNRRWRRACPDGIDHPTI